MAFTFDAKVSASATSSGLTVSHTTGAGADLLVCGIALRGAQTINSLAYGGQALIFAVEEGRDADFERTAIYYLVSPPSGANNLVVGLSASVAHGVSISTWLSDATPSLDVTGTGEGQGGAVSASVSGAVGGLAIDCVSAEENVDPPFTAAGGDQTVLHNFSIAANTFGMGSSYELSPAANETFNWTLGGIQNETWAHVIAVFEEAAPPSSDPDDAPIGRLGRGAGW